MNERTPTPLGDKSARRNYVVFCGVSALVLFLAVLFASLFVSG
jgi:hypothetical protein